MPQSTWRDISLADLIAARERIRPHIRTTPLEYSPSLSKRVNAPVWLKLESQQLTGSFKLRGASHAIARLSTEQRGRGVVTASTGNHGRALTFAARAQGMAAHVCLSADVPQNKVEAIRTLGGEVHIVGHSQDDALAAAQRMADKEGLTLIAPFDQRHIIEGQASLGLELLEQLPDVRQVLVPLSGGGLFAGLALALKAANPAIRLHGISMRGGAAMIQSLQAGRPIEVKEQPTLADSLRGGIGLDNRYSFAITEALVDELHVVDETAIAEAICHAYFTERQIIEGAAAVSIAALLQRLIKPTSPIVAIISGSNIDMRQHLALLGSVPVSNTAATEADFSRSKARGEKFANCK